MGGKVLATMKFFRTITVILILALATSPALAAVCGTSCASKSMISAMNSDDISTLREFLKEQKPRNAILAKAIEIFRNIADRPKAAGSIGKQLSSITIPKDLDQQPQLEYHSNKVSHKIFTPSQVIATGPDNCYAVTGMSVAADDPTVAPPMTVPKVPRNQLCPCGSKKKYKYCHGKK